MNNPGDSLINRIGNFSGTSSIPLKQMKSHALGSFWSDAWQATERLLETLYTGGIGHDDSIL